MWSTRLWQFAKKTTFQNVNKRLGHSIEEQEARLAVLRQQGFKAIQQLREKESKVAIEKRARCVWVAMRSGVKGRCRVVGVVGPRPDVLSVWRAMAGAR